MASDKPNILFMLADDLGWVPRYGELPDCLMTIRNVVPRSPTRDDRG